MSGRCRTCGCPVVWARSADGGRAVALNPIPDPHGRVLLEAGRARPATSEELQRPHGWRYTIHEDTCPRCVGAPAPSADSQQTARRSA